MRVLYDRESDTLTITLREDRIKESDEVRPGVIADFGYDGSVVRFEILDASKVVENTREMQFALAEWPDPKQDGMQPKLTFKYDREADILHIDKCPPYPAQESEELLWNDVGGRVDRQ